MGLDPLLWGANEPEPNPLAPMGPIGNGERAGPAALEDNMDRTWQRPGHTLRVPQVSLSEFHWQEQPPPHSPPTTAFEVHSPLKPSRGSGCGQGGNEVLSWRSLRVGEAA